MKALLLSGWIFFVYAAWGQVRPFPSVDRGLLWKISGRGILEDCYVFGTMHVMDEEDFLFPRQLDSIIRQADQVVMELGEMPDPFKTLQLLTLKEGSFFDYFTKKETSELIKWAKQTLHLEEASFRSLVDHLKPFAVVQMITQLAFQGNIASYELTINRIVKEENRTCLGLETVEEQIGFFDQLSNDAQKLMVLDAIANSNELKEEMDTLQTLYLRENIDSLYLHIQEQEATGSFPQEIFLDQRNTKWIEILRPLLQSNQGVFIAVGAGHLGGPKGILRKIEELGYTMTPIQLQSFR